MASAFAPASHVTWRDSPNYEAARIGRVFNGRTPDRYPRGVVQPKTVEEVVRAVKLANEIGTRLSVRSGGHSWAAWSVRDDALLIDLGQLKCLELDEASGVVKVSPSTTGRVLNAYLGTKGKMFAGGHCPDVGLGGFLLQGGMGWNCKNWGWACEKVKQVDVVTADGKILSCSKDENSDLYWTARGSGPGFPAIVTAFHLETRPTFSHITKSIFMWPLEHFKAVMDWVTDIAPKCDESIELVCLSLRPDPAAEPLLLASFVSFQNSKEAAITSLRIADEGRPLGTVVADEFVPTSLAQEYKDQDSANPEGWRYVSDNAYINNDADVTEVLRDAFTTLPKDTRTFALWFAMNPCSRRHLPDMALSMQSDHYFALYTVWQDKQDDERCIAWVKNIMSGVEKHSVGAYLGDADFQVRRTRFWEDAQGKQLMELRRKLDPQGRICGFLDHGDTSGIDGLANRHEW